MEETRRLRQKEDPGVRNGNTEKGELDSAAVRASGREGRQEEDEMGPKRAQKLTLAVWCEKEAFISRTPRNTDGWWRSGGGRDPGGAGTCPACRPRRRGPRPAAPRRALRTASAPAALPAPARPSPCSALA